MAAGNYGSHGLSSGAAAGPGYQSSTFAATAGSINQAHSTDANATQPFGLHTSVASSASADNASSRRLSILRDFQVPNSVPYGHSVSDIDVHARLARPVLHSFLGIPERLEPPRMRAPMYRSTAGSAVVLDNLPSSRMTFDDDEAHRSSANYLTEHMQRYSNSSILAIVLTLTLAIFGGLAIWHKPPNRANTGYQMLYFACALAVYLLLRCALWAGLRLAEPRAYSSRWFYLADRQYSDVAFAATGALSMVLSHSTFAATRCGPSFLEALWRFDLVLMVVFCSSVLKTCIERLWIEKIHVDLFGRELDAIVMGDKVLCHLCTCAATNELEWRTERMPPHSHDFARTLRALLGVALPVEYHARDEADMRIDAVHRTHDIMLNVDLDGKDYITLADMLLVARNDHAKARAMMQVIGASASSAASDDDLVVHRDEIVNAIFSHHQQRADKFKLLRDRGQMATVLHRFTGAIFWFFAALFALYVFGFDVFTLVLPVATSFIGLAFIFGTSAAAAFQSFLVIFVIRPLASGDRFTIPGFPTLIVERFFLFTTECHSPDGKMWIVPNQMLFNTVITQYRRSQDYCSLY